MMTLEERNKVFDEFIEYLQIARQSIDPITRYNCLGKIQDRINGLAMRELDAGMKREANTN